MATSYPNSQLLLDGEKLQQPSTFDPASLKKLKKDQALDLMQLSIDESAHFSQRVQNAKAIWITDQRQIKKLEARITELEAKLDGYDRDFTSLEQAHKRLMDDKRELTLILDAKFGELRAKLQAQGTATPSTDCPI